MIQSKPATMVQSSSCVVAHVLHALFALVDLVVAALVTCVEAAAGSIRVAVRTILCDAIVAALLGDDVGTATGFTDVKRFAIVDVAQLADVVLHTGLVGLAIRGVSTVADMVPRRHAKRPVDTLAAAASLLRSRAAIGPILAAALVLTTGRVDRTTDRERPRDATTFSAITGTRSSAKALLAHRADLTRARGRLGGRCKGSKRERQESVETLHQHHLRIAHRGIRPISCTASLPSPATRHLTRHPSAPQARPKANDGPTPDRTGRKQTT